MDNLNTRLEEGFSMMQDDDPADAKPQSDDILDQGFSDEAVEEFLRGTTDALQDMRDARDD